METTKEIKPKKEKKVVKAQEISAETLIKPKKGYIEAVGRRKTSVARVRMFTSSDHLGEVSVNEKTAENSPLKSGIK